MGAVRHRDEIDPELKQINLASSVCFSLAKAEMALPGRWPLNRGILLRRGFPPFPELATAGIPRTHASREAGHCNQRYDQGCG
jgi:hypothetical protein